MNSEQPEISVDSLDNVVGSASVVSDSEDQDDAAPNSILFRREGL